MKRIASIQLSRVQRIEIIVTNCRKSLDEVKAETGADYILNGGMWNPDGSPCAGLKVGGKLLSKTPWGNVHGYGWTDTDIHMTLDWENSPNYLAVSPIIKDGAKYPEKTYAAAQDGVRGRSAIGMTKDALVLYCSGDGTSDSSDPEALTQELLALGCDSAMMLDGGGSSQCDFTGEQIKATRKVHNWICVWTKKTAETPPDKEDKPVSKPIVCLDPGHGPGCVNGSLDGSYRECDFTWDMYTRLRPLLEAQGITVVGTREQESDYPSLSARASVSNRAGADLFVSLHSNAAGSSARGFVAFTSAPPETAARNRLAAAIINRIHAAGVVLWDDGLAHEMYTVLASTTAPAVLLEYGFHTNAQDLALLKDTTYRDKLAQATCAGICDYLGLEVKEPDQESGQPNEPDGWAREAWSKAVAAGVFDGTRPRDALTRQEAAVVLDRLGLLPEKGA